MPMPQGDNSKYEGRFKNVRCWRQKQPPRDEYYRPLLMSIEMSRPKRHCCCTKPPPPLPNYPCPECDGVQTTNMAYAMNLCCKGNNACGACAANCRNGNGGGNGGCGGGNGGCGGGNGGCGGGNGGCGGGCGGGNGGCGGGSGGCGGGCGGGNGGCGGGCGGGNGGGCGGGGGGCGGGGNGGGGRMSNSQGCLCKRLPGQGPCDPPCFSTMIFPPYTPLVPEPRCYPEPVNAPTSRDGCSLAPVGGTSMIGAYTRSCWSCNTCGNGKMDVCNIPFYGCNNSPCNPNRSASCSGNGNGFGNGNGNGNGQFGGYSKCSSY